MFNGFSPTVIRLSLLLIKTVAVVKRYFIANYKHNTLNVGISLYTLVAPFFRTKKAL